MKMDKTGAATVIAAIETVARLAPGTPLLAIAPAVENMPGPHSTRPGDVVKALNGKMVDITNTDAEGRLILGDAMTYAEQLGATHLVDVATLTGAVARALGPSRDRSLRHAAGLVRRGARGRRPGPASATGRSRSSTTTSPTWTAGTATSRTPARPTDRWSRAVCSSASSSPAHGSTSTSAGPATSASRLPFAPRGSNGVTHATLVELALAGAG